MVIGLAGAEHQESYQEAAFAAKRAGTGTELSFMQGAANHRKVPVARAVKSMQSCLMANRLEKSNRAALRLAEESSTLPGVSQYIRSPDPVYLIAHACFHCKKSWKKKPDASSCACPECGGPISVMGRSFKAPKKSDDEQWEKVKRLYAAGFRFESYRSFPGVEPLPERLAEVDDFISRNPHHPCKLYQTRPNCRP